MHALASLFFLILPFQFALQPAEGVDLPLSRVLVLVLFFLWLSEGFRRRRLIILPPSLLSATLFFSVWILLSSLWALEPLWGFRKGAFLLNFLLLLFPLYPLASGADEKTPLAKAAVWGALLSGVAGLLEFGLQFLVGVEPIYRLWTETLLPFFLGPAFGASVAAYPSLLVNVSGETLLRASAFFPDPHLFGLYMAMAVFLALGLASGSARKGFLIVALILVLAVLCSFSRGAYLGLLSGGLFFTSRSLSFRPSAKQVGAALLGLFFLSAVFSLSPAGSRFLSIFTGDGSAAARSALLKEALGHIRERPLAGVGLGSYPVLVDPSADYRTPIYAHNLYLDLASEVGLIGLAGFLLLVILSWRSPRASARSSLLERGIRASLVVFFVHSLFETPIYSVEVLPLFLLLLVLLRAPWSTMKGHAHPSPSS
jgi:O-antigen ligase